MCSNAHQCLEDGPGEHRHLAAFLPSVRGVRHTGCKPECEVADVRDFSIQPCCPGFARESHVADRKTRPGGKAWCYGGREYARRVRALPKPTPGAAARRPARPAVSPAKARKGGRGEVRQARLRGFTTCAQHAP